MPQNYVVFTLDDGEYAVDILKAQEVIILKDITIHRVPKVPIYIRGIINLRGDAIPIMDLKERFEFTNAVNEEKRIIIVENKKLIFGFLADKILEVLEINDEEIIPTTEEVKLRCKYVDAIICKEKRMIFILDISKIIELETELEQCPDLI